MPDHATVARTADDEAMTRYTKPKNLRLIGIVVGIVALLIVIFGIASRLWGDHTVSTWTDDQAIPTVKLVGLQGQADGRNLVLPGTVQAYNSAQIFARVSGYLKKWYVDIGSPVKARQLMAQIDIPDQDQQLLQAEADLNTAIANQKLSAVTAKRWNDLLKVQAVAPQDVDEKNGDLAAKTAAVASARANVDRLKSLVGFERVTAPFDGVVTSRGIDIGALVPVGAPGDTPLFTVTDQTKLRLYVNVPQSYGGQLKPGMAATFTVPEFPDRVFKAQISSQANAVTAQSGTFLVQLQADNSDGMLKPGAYAQVKFDLPTSTSAVEVPSSALIFGTDGMQAATVGPNGHVVMKQLKIGHDYGTTVEVLAGLSVKDKVIDNPPDSLRQGDPVRVAPRK
jgi:RND family efflux transporter MFP subunit